MRSEYWDLPVGVGLISLMLAACGGGGDDEEDGFEIDDADATGVWTGTNTPGGGAPVSATVVIEPNGRFAIVTSAVFLSGTGTTSANAFSANATGWPPVNTTFANGSTVAPFTLTGTVFEESSIDGTYSGANESGTLSLSYNVPFSNTNASLAIVAGTYSSSSGQTSLAITNGSMTLNSTAGPSMNCIGNGTISAPAPTRNVYTWNMTLTGCNDNGQAEGVAFMPTTNTLALIGRSPNVPFSFSLTK